MAGAGKFSIAGIVCLVLASTPLYDARSFTIDYTNNVFLKDSLPFRYIAGSLHYFRVPRFYWKDRLTKMKFSGLNAVQTYVAWNVHEPQNGTYNFEGENDLEEFIKIADSVGLLVILRAGPYICGEWELGGFPPWLIKNTSIILRSSKDPVYLSAVDRWMGVLLPKMKPLLYNNGGPIITVQVENEYGSYFTCDHVYMGHLEKLFRYHLGNDTVLFTTDGASESMLKCGSLPTLYTTVDFGPGVDPANPFRMMRQFQPSGPLVNSEFYPGWLDHWGERHQTVNAARVAKYLDMMLAMNASVNLYMFEGGSSFGFMNGANCGGNVNQYQPQPTSYDYDAPLTEAGDLTTKYYLLLEIIASYMGPPSSPAPPNTPKYAYGKVQLNRMSRLLDVLPLMSPKPPVNATLPLTMEQLGQDYGFVMYETDIPDKYRQQTLNISIPGVRDRAIIYVGKIRQATIIRVGKTSASITVGNFLTLSILIENMGRINYGPHLVDPKGILGNVTLGSDVLLHWRMYPLNIDNLLGQSSERLKDYVTGEDDANAPTFFAGEIPPASDGVPKDTFIHMDSWAKGQIYINGFNVGRYWPAVGPQVSLYVPASILSSGQRSSKLVILELDENPCDYPEGCFVTFKDTPVINGGISPLGFTGNDKVVLNGRKEKLQWLSKYTEGEHSNRTDFMEDVETRHRVVN